MLPVNFLTELKCVPKFDYP